MRVSLDIAPCGAGEIATITYDRRDKLNVLDRRAIAELTEAVMDAGARESVRCAVICGAGGRAFIGGADVHDMHGLDTDGARAFITTLYKLFAAIRSLPVPVIAGIEGYCLGAGMELAAACDIRLAADTAVFGMPEVQVGIPSVIEAALLPRLVGQGRAAYLVLTGKTIDAATAHEWGFTERLIGKDGLQACIDDVAEAIASAGPEAVRSQKALLRTWAERPLDDAIRSGIDAFASAYRTREPHEMMQAFIDRKSKG